MSKGPGVLPGGRPTVERQTHYAHAEAKLRLYHLGQPVVCGIGLLILATVLHTFFRGFWTVVLVAGCGLLITGLDYRLRSNRKHWEARAVGSVTALASTGWLVAAISFPKAVSLAWLGFSKPMFLTWLVGWILGSIVWVIWILSGEHKDEIRQNQMAAEDAGLSGMRVSLDRKKRRDRDTPGTSGMFRLPPGATIKDAVSRLPNWESARGAPPNSWILSPDRENAQQVNFQEIDPNLLAREILPWPFGLGGSNSGASISEPIQPALWADGSEMMCNLVNSHRFAMGMTGSGKTVTWAYNLIGEGITRHDYACLAADISAQEMMLGPLRPALHGFATKPEEVLAQMAALERISDARAAFLAAKQMTQWEPGCGLMLLHIWWEEVADIVALLESRERGGGKERLERWKSRVRNMRKYGCIWDISTQRNDADQVPTLIRAQMGRVCFGVENTEDARFGLTEEQLNRGASPQSWHADIPGMFYIDAPGIPDQRKAMPARGWYRNASEMAAFAVQHPASARPLDDVTGEALEAEPSPAATSAFSVTPAMMQAGAGLTSPGPVAGERPPLYAVPDGWRPPKLAKERALDIVRQRLAELRADWKSDRPQLIKRSDLNDLAKQLDRSSQQMGNYLNMLVTNPAELLVKRDDIKQGYYQILPEPVQREGTE